MLCESRYLTKNFFYNKTSIPISSGIHVHEHSTIIIASIFVFSIYSKLNNNILYTILQKKQ